MNPALRAVAPGFALGCALALALGACDGRACDADNDCKADRICEAGACVSPNVGGDTGEADAGDDAADEGPSKGDDEGGGDANDGGEAPDDDSGDDGAPAAMCPFPNADGVATLSEGLPSAAESASATFTSGGGLDSVDGSACAPDGNAPMPQRFNPEAHDCAEAYLCGDCQFWILDNAESGFILAGDSEEACPQYAGFFLFGVDGDTGGDADDDGGATCVPACGLNEFCSDGECTCPSGCRQGTVCCGGSLCAGDCIGTPCCT